jgi:hypothetical protein
VFPVVCSYGKVEPSARLVGDATCVGSRITPVYGMYKTSQTILRATICDDSGLMLLKLTSDHTAKSEERPLSPSVRPVGMAIQRT